MADITGIALDLYVAASSIYDGTADPLYLGVYGTDGGREFRLEMTEGIGTTTEGIVSVQGVQEKVYLGALCHFTPAETPVQIVGSNGGLNDPRTCDLDLDSVQFVYLKKRLRKDVNKDDRLILSQAEVFLCDGTKTREFKQSCPMPFGYEAGGKHWLVGDPVTVNPSDQKCHVTVTLKSIKYSNKSVGKKIRFNTTIGGQQHSGYDGDFDKGETIYPGTTVFSGDLGNCGQNFSLSFESEIREEGSVENNGTTWNSYSAPCPGTYEHPTLVTVKKKNSNKYAHFDLVYCIEATCV